MPRLLMLLFMSTSAMGCWGSPRDDDDDDDWWEEGEWEEGNEWGDSDDGSYTPPGDNTDGTPPGDTGEPNTDEDVDADGDGTSDSDDDPPADVDVDDGLPSSDDRDADADADGLPPLDDPDADDGPPPWDDPDADADGVLPPWDDPDADADDGTPPWDDPDADADDGTPPWDDPDADADDGTPPWDDPDADADGTGDADADGTGPTLGGCIFMDGSCADGLASGECIAFGGTWTSTGCPEEDVCEDLEGWYDIIGRSCDSYDESDCGDALFYVGDGMMSALEACCSCGGGEGGVEPEDPIAGGSCDGGGVYDCDLRCVAASSVAVELGDGVCDDRSPRNLDCEAFDYDEGDCIDDGCELLPFGDGYDQQSTDFDWVFDGYSAGFSVYTADSFCVRVPSDTERLSITIELTGIDTDGWTRGYGPEPQMSDLSVDGTSLIDMEPGWYGFDVPYGVAWDGAYSLGPNFTMNFPFSGPDSSPRISGSTVEFTPGVVSYGGLGGAGGTVHFVANNEDPYERENVLELNIFISEDLLVDGTSFASSPSSGKLATTHLEELVRFFEDSSEGSTEVEIAYTGILSDDYSDISVSDEFYQLTAITSSAVSPQSLNLFVVESLTYGSDTDGVILGVAGGRPGAALPANLSGTLGHGVAVAVAGMRTSAWSDAPISTDTFAHTSAHEIGHYLGLFHTSESSGYGHDPLADTPECLTYFEITSEWWETCPSDAVRNLMWPYAYGDALPMTPEQQHVVSNNPLVK